MIIAFGDSFVQGCQDMGVTIKQESIERFSISFVSKIAKKLNLEFKNYAIRGSSNFVQLDLLLDKVTTFQPDDIILFGITSSIRDRASAIASNPNIINEDSPHNLVWKKVGNLTNRIVTNDFYFTIAVLNQIEQDFGIKIIKFNTFENQLTQIDNFEKNKIIVKNYIGKDIKNNTLFDIVNNTYDTDTEINNLPKITTHLNVLPDREQYFTSKKHPNELGHQIIADWFLENVFR